MVLKNLIVLFVAFHKMVQLNDFERNLTDIVIAITPKKAILISPAPVDEGLQHARTNAVLKQYAETVRAISVATSSHHIDLFTNMVTKNQRQFRTYRSKTAAGFIIRVCSYLLI
jgi:hypothetical protein